MRAAGHDAKLHLTLASAARVKRAGRNAEALALLREARALASVPAASLDAEIAALEWKLAPRAEIAASWRHRSGEPGLGRFSDRRAEAQVSTALGLGRIWLRGELVDFDSVRPRASALARFGRNPELVAQTLADGVTRPLAASGNWRRTGAGISAGFENDGLEAEAGLAPPGLGKRQATFRLAVSRKVARGLTASAAVARAPVADSLVSVAGGRDPVTGAGWGRMMRTSATFGLSQDHDGNGFYGELRYGRYAGIAVRDNEGVEANGGAYWRLEKRGQATLTAGINLNVQSFRHNEYHFSFGSGGYFSPQSFVGIGTPLTWRLERARSEIRLSATPGFQTLREARSPVFPTDPAAQARLVAMQAVNPLIEPWYRHHTRSGLAFAAEASGSAWIARRTRLTDEASFNSFGGYTEARVMLRLQQGFGGTR